MPAHPGRGRRRVFLGCHVRIRRARTSWRIQRFWCPLYGASYADVFTNLPVESGAYAAAVESRIPRLVEIALAVNTFPLTISYMFRAASLTFRKSSSSGPKNGLSAVITFNTGAQCQRAATSRQWSNRKFWPLISGSSSDHTGDESPGLRISLRSTSC